MANGNGLGSTLGWVVFFFALIMILIVVVMITSMCVYFFFYLFMGNNNGVGDDWWYWLYGNNGINNGNCGYGTSSSDEEDDSVWDWLTGDQFNWDNVNTGLLDQGPSILPVGDLNRGGGSRSSRNVNSNRNFNMRNGGGRMGQSARPRGFAGSNNPQQFMNRGQQMGPMGAMGGGAGNMPKNPRTQSIVNRNAAPNTIYRNDGTHPLNNPPTRSLYSEATARVVSTENKRNQTRQRINIKKEEEGSVADTPPLMTVDDLLK